MSRIHFVGGERKRKAWRLEIRHAHIAGRVGGTKRRIDVVDVDGILRELQVGIAHVERLRQRRHSE